MITQKPWGTTQVIHQSDTLLIHKIHVNPGGYCSLHHHERRVNQFIVISGTLDIDVESKRWCLSCGMSITVRYGDRHRFLGFSDVDAYEIYWNPDGSNVDPEDIVRVPGTSMEEQ